MKNEFFQLVRKRGLKYRKDQGGIVINERNAIFKESVSFAYKFWAIAERYHSSDLFVDELPNASQISDFIDVLRLAGITSFVISFDVLCRACELEEAGCILAEECKVFRRETELFDGKLEKIRGIRVLIGDK